MTTFERVYAAVRLIPRGSVATYGQIARAIGNPRLARVVGYALHVNPEPGVIPCHRVVRRDGAVSSAFAFGGASEQRGGYFVTDRCIGCKRGRGIYGREPCGYGALLRAGAAVHRGIENTLLLRIK